MADTFVPLPRPNGTAKTNGFVPLALKTLPQPANQAAHSEACREPAVTLQRDGEKITAIRIECVCGQVIELGCEY